MKVIVYLSALLTVIGGLNCGLIGFFDFNAIETFICCPNTLQIVYCIIGLAAVVVTLAVAGTFGCMCCGCNCGCNCGCDKKCTCDIKAEEKKEEIKVEKKAEKKEEKEEKKEKRSLTKKVNKTKGK